jgi:hypothetical protein
MRGLQHGYVALVTCLYLIAPCYSTIIYRLWHVCVQVSYLATDSLFPEWKIWTQFLAESTEGLKLDGLAESHPIEVIFDGLSSFPGYISLRN